MVCGLRRRVGDHVGGGLRVRWVVQVRGVARRDVRLAGGFPE